VRWTRLHGYGSRRSRGLSFGSAGRTVNVWRISPGRFERRNKSGAELSASTNVSGVVAIAGSFRVFIAVLRSNDPSLHSQIRPKHRRLWS